MTLTLKLLRTAAALAFVAAPAHVADGRLAAAPAAQCRGTDRAIPKRIRFARGRTTAVIKDRVRLCTSHDYGLRARAGQTMSIHLAAGGRTSFTLQSPAGTVEGADGVKDWSGELPETGGYVIVVGTDVTAAYTLEVTIR